jgi:hypothetical protein
MKLATFDGPAGRHLGIVEDDEIADLTVVDSSLATMTDLLERGSHEVASRYSSSAPRLPLASVKLAAPVPRPPKFLAIGYNTPNISKKRTPPDRLGRFGSTSSRAASSDRATAYGSRGSRPMRSTTKANWGW